MVNGEHVAKSSRGELLDGSRGGHIRAHDLHQDTTHREDPYGLARLANHTQRARDGDCHKIDMSKVRKFEQVMVVRARHRLSTGF